MPYVEKYEADPKKEGKGKRSPINFDGTPHIFKQ